MSGFLEHAGQTRHHATREPLISGLGGAIYVHYNATVSPTSFNMIATLWLFMYVLVGGIGSFVGPIIGTFLLIMIPEFVRELKVFVPFISAIKLLIVVFVMPQGLVGLPKIVGALFTVRGKDKIVSHAS